MKYNIDYKGSDVSALSGAYRSKLVNLINVATTLSSSNELISKPVKVRTPKDSWENKKCKTCKSCGSNCYPYTYKSKLLYRFSKPKYKACKYYESIK